MPDVSVVIPTRDRGSLLRKALRSALRQRDVDFEILVVDDGSADKVAMATDLIDGSRHRLLRHDRPLGVAAARNAGAALARAPWVAFLDDDDLWAPNKLARQLEAASEARVPWAYGGAIEIDATDRMLGGSPPAPPAKLIAELRRKNSMPAGCSNVIVRTDVLRDTGGFDPGLRHLADWDMWLRLAGYGRPACVAAPLVAYRLHSGQATLDTSGMAAESNVLKARYGADRASIHRWAAWSYLRAGRRWKAVSCYGRAIAVGDVKSVARAVLTLFHPAGGSGDPSRMQRSRNVNEKWRAEAQAWLDELVADETDCAGGSAS